MPARERETWRAPIPEFIPVHRKVGRDLFLSSSCLGQECPLANSRIDLLNAPRVATTDIAPVRQL